MDVHIWNIEEDRSKKPTLPFLLGQILLMIDRLRTAITCKNSCYYAAILLRKIDLITSILGTVFMTEVATVRFYSINIPSTSSFVAYGSAFLVPCNMLFLGD